MFRRPRSGDPRSRTRTSTPWTPRKISGLQLWLRADLGITLNGSNVSAWADQSGNGNHVVQAVAANQPAWSATASTNGNAAITFDGAAGNNDALRGGTNVTVGHLFVVAKGTPATFPGYSGLFTGWDSNDNTQVYYTGDNGTGNWFVAGTQPNFTRVKDGTATPTNAGLQAQHVYEGSDTTPATQTSIAVGVDRDVAINRTWPGWVAEVIVYASALSATDASTVRTYLGLRYGITVV